jgi:hypothetical protein
VFTAFAFAAIALIPGLPSRAVVVLVILAVFLPLGWARVLDSDERAQVRGIALRATARFRLA